MLILVHINHVNSKFALSHRGFEKPTHWKIKDRSLSLFSAVPFFVCKMASIAQRVIPLREIKTNEQFH